MLGHVDRGATVFTTQRQTLQDAQNDQNNGREPAGCCIAGQSTNKSRCTTHNRERHDKSIFSPDEITNASEKKCAERPYCKTNKEGRQISDVLKQLISGRIKLGRQIRGQRAENI